MLAPEAFADKPWEGVIAGACEATCFVYCSTFCGRAQGEDDPLKKAIWRFLARITSFSLALDSREGPFDGAVQGYSEEEIDLVRALLPEVEDAELRARMADIVWTREHKGHFQYAQLAVENYLKSATRLEDPRHWVDCAKRIERAFRLAYALRNAELCRDVISHIEGVLTRCDGEDPLYLSARMMGLLLEAGAGDPGTYVALSEKLAQRAEDEQDFDRAKEFWVLKSRWHKMEGDEEAARKAALSAAETHVKTAEKRKNEPGAPYLHAAGHLQFAIKAFREIQGTQERVKDLHRLLLEYQPKSVTEFSRFEDSVDLTQAASEASRRVSDKSFKDALLSLAFLLKPASVAALRVTAERIAQECVIQSLFPSTRLNSMGKVVARQPGLRADTPEEVDTAIRSRMYEQASIQWELNAQGVIEPARRQLVSEHQIRVQDFAPFVTNNPLVPRGREHIYAQGLHAGMVGDFLVAIHLLIPQVENSMRAVLYENAEIASTLTSDGYQQEIDLNRTLTEPRFAAVLEKIFGIDLIFDLRGLLVDEFGANLRNEMAHGLLNAGAFYSSPAVYVWWLVLRFCCLPFIQQLVAPQDDAPAE